MGFESTRVIWGWETGCVEKTKGVKRILNVELAPAGDDSEKKQLDRRRHKAQRNQRFHNVKAGEAPCFHRSL